MRRFFIIMALAAIVFMAGCHKKETYTVTFNANGGTGKMQTQTFEEGVESALRANTFTYENHSFVNWNTAADGGGTIYIDGEKVILTEDLVLYAQWDLKDHNWVDLGLPSGTLWATCNLGANSPEEYGNYYAWGEIYPQSDNAYGISSYKYADGTSWLYPKLTKYCNLAKYGNNGYTDTYTVLLPEDDAATSRWGNGWRLPTQDELKELKDYCTVTPTNMNGVEGLLFSRNGNTLFLPAAGYRQDGIVYFDGLDGYYLSSSLDTNDPRNSGYLMFDPGNPNDNTYPWSTEEYCHINSYYRSYGRSVRPVCNQVN